MSSPEHLTGFERFSVQQDFEDLMDILTKIQLAAAGSAASANPAYTRQVAALTQDVSYIKKHAERLKTDDLNRSRIDELLSHLMDAAKPHLKFAWDGSKIEKKNMEQLLQVVTRLKVLVPRPPETTKTAPVESLVPVKKKDSPFTSKEEKSEAATAIVEAMAELEVEEWMMAGLRESYNSLDLTQKLCLLCFSVFPREHDSLVVKKKIMIYWWAGEGFIENCDREKTTTIEETGEKILEVLADKGFIERVMVKGRVSGSCRMHPFVQSFVVVLAKRAGFFDFRNKNGEISSSFNLSQRACLVKLQDKPPSSSSQRWGREAAAGGLRQFETVQTLFNVNVSVIHIGLEWFRKMNHLSVLRLGSWRSGDHIEVHDHKFMEELKSMRQLKLVSLQGMSTIFKLPDSVCKLTNLMILDLRKCHSLKKLPDDIGDLKNLTHLDLTMCHLLTKLPKGISSLPSLEVLKGFVVNEHARESTTTTTTQEHHNSCFFLGRRKDKKEICVLRDLQKLVKLRELSMVAYGDEFPNGDELEVLKKMETLRKLKITWERSLKDKKKSGASMEVSTDSHEVERRVFDQIEKLELWCVPWRKAPDWFAAGQLKNLKRLYIKGGKLEDLPGGGEDDEWGVETLRLKYLPELVVSWDELVKTKFPKMAYLERFGCNKLGLFPCDEEGVWRKEDVLT